MVESPLMVRWIADRSLMGDPLSYFSLQPVLSAALSIRLTRLKPRAHQGPTKIRGPCNLLGEGDFEGPASAP